MANKKYEIRNSQAPTSKSIVVSEGNKMILYIIPQEIDPIKFKDFQEQLLAMLNNESN